MNSADVVERYLTCLKNGDLEGFPVAEDMVFEDPLTNGRQTGKAAFLAFIGGVTPLFRDLRIHRMIVQGDTVAAHWDAHLVMGVIPVLEMFTVRDGFVREAFALFDPRPITNPAP